MLVATIEQALVNGVATGTATTYYVHPDHLGSTNVITNSAGVVKQALDYYPYGAPRINTGTDASERRFIGQFADDATSLDYLNARYYDPARGQFTSQDPVFWEVGQTADGKAALSNPQSMMNSYAYAGGNPVTNKDANGKFWWEGFYDWSGYNGTEGVMMKAGEVFGGHARALNAIQRNQGTVVAMTGQYGVDPALANAIIYEEQSHLMPDEAFGREQAFPNLGSGGVGVMQVSGPVGKEYNYSKEELARDPRKNIQAGVANIAKEQSRSNGSVALTASRYNYNPANNVTAYGQRVAAQASNPNYNRNVLVSGLQKLVTSLALCRRSSRCIHSSLCNWFSRSGLQVNLTIMS